jgi:RNA polymerase sigma factor (TIGR02999 family)
VGSDRPHKTVLFFFEDRRYNRRTPRVLTMNGSPGDVTVLLRRWRSGDREAESALFRLLMPDLHKIAARCFRGERPGHILQPTALVNEAFLRLAKVKKVEWADRQHFLALAARVMRRYLIDHARSQPSVRFLPMEGMPEAIIGNRTSLELAVSISTLLDELETDAPLKCAIVELKFFLGLTDTEAADVLNLKLHTLQREWHRTRVWLFERLSAESCKAAVKTTGE